MKFIIAREKEIEKSAAVLSDDQAKLWQRISQDTARLNTFVETVEKYGNELRITDPNRKIDENQKKRIAGNLSWLKQRCENFKFEPFLGISRKMVEQIDTMIAGLSSDKEDEDSRKNLSKGFVRIFAMAKIIEVQHRLVQLRHDYFPPNRKIETVNFEMLLSQLVELRKFFGDRQIADNVAVDDYLIHYTKILDFLNGIIGLLNKTLQNSDSPKDVLESIPLRLAQFDLMEIMHVAESQKTKSARRLPPGQMSLL